MKDLAEIETFWANNPVRIVPKFIGQMIIRSCTQVAKEQFK